MNNTDAEFVSPLRYREIKDMGPFTEQTIKGVTMLTEHSCGYLKGKSVVRTPYFSPPPPPASFLQQRHPRQHLLEDSLRANSKLRRIQIRFGAIEIHISDALSKNTT